MRVFFQDGPTARTQLKVHAKFTKGDGQQEKKNHYIHHVSFQYVHM